VPKLERVQGTDFGWHRPHQELFSWDEHGRGIAPGMHASGGKNVQATWGSATPEVSNTAAM
jgi:hypothetical protein